MTDIFDDVANLRFSTTVAQAHRNDPRGDLARACLETGTEPHFRPKTRGYLP